ncbi:MULTISPECIES: sensor histidine kinase [Streptomyces]|uniref:sensor histidine kinase n=1 Tax=Streptomyces TaxID=1883 RepID=UPI000F744A3F|nr:MULTISPECIES: sensor histidine kinase [Streptomyces]MCM3264291.1 sensor histidine kinase [Streptomyces thermoviolaceus]RSS08391.1 sensor histidine kinase [Streptomyces sp. WAC00469]WTD49439.1 sensor histidine kinase [Streptomyces thermoviolaceus]GGV61182.1 two-component sensor histidine kinase [Streptomyces thermoviolaceus subsp. apingens]
MRKSWSRRVAVRAAGIRQAVRDTREAQRYGKANRRRLRAEWAAAREAGDVPETPGPPPNGCSLLPWLLMGLGSLSNLLRGKTPAPWIGALGLLAITSLYVYVVFRAFHRRTREATSTRVALLLLGLATTGLGLGYGGNWLLFFPLLGLAVGATVRGRRLGATGIPLAVLAGAVSAVHNGWSGFNVAYATLLSTMVTAAILSLSEAVRELRAAREELARRAVEEERLRFSRDLHDLLGHTLSVIVVKSEAARRLADRDLQAALEQISDIESVGRQALTEIREAVTGYREGCLSTELDRARSALTAAGIEPVVRRSGPPLAPQTEALLGWVVREAVTNAVRHSGADRCEITVAGGSERVRLTVADNGRGVPDTGGRATPGAGDGGPAPGTAGRPAAARGVGGTGLKGLTERLAAAGGSLRTGPAPRGGFMVTAELPTDGEVAASPGSGAAAGAARPAAVPAAAAS